MSGVRIIFILLFSQLALSSWAQIDVYDHVQVAIKSGHARGLTLYFNNYVDIKTTVEEDTYAKNQAEFILKKFFTSNPPKDFFYEHKGTSASGSIYAIGTYITKQNDVFRVLMKMKKSGDDYLIDELSFTKE